MIKFKLTESEFNKFNKYLTIGEIEHFINNLNNYRDNEDDYFSD